MVENSLKTYDLILGRAEKTFQKRWQRTMEGLFGGKFVRFLEKFEKKKKKKLRKLKWLIEYKVGAQCLSIENQQHIFTYSHERNLLSLLLLQ